MSQLKDKRFRENFKFYKGLLLILKILKIFLENFPFFPELILTLFKNSKNMIMWQGNTTDL